MEKNSRTRSRELIVYFVMALVFALLSVPARKLIRLGYSRANVSFVFHGGWIFWICVIVSFVSLLPLIRALLILLSERGALPKVIGQVVQLQFGSRVQDTIEKMRSIAFGVVGRLVFSGVGIILAVLILWRTGAIHDDEINSNLYNLEVRSLGRFARTSNLTIVSLNNFPLASLNKYYENYLRLVQGLKLAGVRAVLLEPSMFGVDKRDLQFLKEIENTGIVVFGAKYLTFKAPVSHGEFHWSNGALTISEHELDEMEPLSRIRPSGLERGPRAYPDVTIELLRKYKGYTDDLPVDESNGEVRFGDFRIPVTRDGWMYSLDKYNSTYSELQFVDSSGSWVEPDGSRFSTPGLKGAGLKLEDGGYPYPFRYHDIGDELRGKIVILDFYATYSFQYSRAYAVALENMITGHVIKKSEQGHLWFSIACLIIAGFVAYRFRPLVTIFLIILLAAATIFVWYYLFEGQNLLIDIFYPLLALAMSAVAFPAIMIGNGGRLKEESVISK